MRRLTGTYDGQAYVLVEYPNGMIECPEVLRATLQQADGRLPRGEALDDACLVLFGDTLRVHAEPEER